MSDLDTRLTKAINLRNRLSAESQRIAGRKEAAEKALADVESEIRSKKLDPDTLDETLTMLTEAYEKAVAEFEADVAKAQESLSPYMENNP